MTTLTGKWGWGAVAIGLAAAFSAGQLYHADSASFAPTSKLSPESWLNQRRMSGSTISLASVYRANQDLLALIALSRERAPKTAEAVWAFHGPQSIGGRVLDLAVDPNQPDTLYAATASGGLWKSTDAASTFSRAWPDANAQAVGALAVTSTGRLYAGVGEGGPNGTSPTLGNKGIFVSDDGATTWTSLGLADSARIGRIAIDPGDQNRVFVAATGPVFAAGGQRGVYRSTDAGQTWALVLAGQNDTTGATDVAIDPTNANRVYAVMWQHIRGPEARYLGGEGSGIFRSDDGGDTWARLAGGLPPSNADIGRIALGLAPTNPNRLYATYIDASGFFTALHRSDDGGNNWSQMPFSSSLSNSQSSFGWWFGRTWVDPADQNRVFAAGVRLTESTNGGSTWIQRTGHHADQHAMAWDPEVPGRVYLGNDGGVYRSDSGGSSPWFKGAVQPFTQFYTVDVSEQNPSRRVGGTQDNNCLRSWTAGNASLWNAYGCGDGLETLINYKNQDIVYGCSQGGSCIRSTNGGETAGNIGATTSTRRGWQTPFMFDPNNPSVMYYAGNIVNRSTNGGLSFSVISGDLTGGDPIPGDTYTFGTVSALAVAKSDASVLYAGTDDSRVWSTTDLGNTWLQSTDPDLPQRWVTDLAVHPTDAATAYITYSGYRDGDNTPYVLKTSDHGSNWTDITGDLPAAPLNSVALTQAGVLIVGGDIGVFFSIDDGATWDVLGQGLPRSPVMDLRIHEPSATLYAATFGAGIRSVALPAPDSDGDGVPDVSDNCLLVQNPAQIDTDADGYGNLCDADFNADCVVNFLDLGTLRASFFMVGELATDLNGDGNVNYLDLGLMRAQFFQPPGPSGTQNVCAAGDRKAQTQ